MVYIFAFMYLYIFYVYFSYEILFLFIYLFIYLAFISVFVYSVMLKPGFVLHECNLCWIREWEGFKKKLCVCFLLGFFSVAVHIYDLRPMSDDFIQWASKIYDHKSLVLSELMY